VLLPNFLNKNFALRPGGGKNHRQSSTKISPMTENLLSFPPQTPDNLISLVTMGLLQKIRLYLSGV